MNAIQLANLATLLPHLVAVPILLSGLIGLWIQS